MKALALLILFALLVVGAFALSDLHSLQWGRITLALSDRQIEMGLPSLVLFLLAGGLFVYFLKSLWRLPRRWVDQWQQLSVRKKEKMLLEGVSMFARGEWQKAHRCFAGVDKPAMQASLAQLLSALALIKEQSFDEARRILRGLSTSDLPGIKHMTAIGEAEIDLLSNRNEQAFSELQNLLALYPDNKHITAMLLRAFVNQDRSMPATLRNRLLNEIGNQGESVVPKEAERRLLEESLREQLEQKNKGGVNRIWHKMRKPMQKEMAGLYAQCLVRLGQDEQAEHLMQSAIEEGWGQHCLDDYALMDGGNTQRRIRMLEQWLADKPQEPALLLCLGKLYQRSGEMEKAQRCMNLCLRYAAPQLTIRQE